MGTSNCSDSFKRDTVHQNTARDYPVREVTQRLSVTELRCFHGFPIRFPPRKSCGKL